MSNSLSIATNGLLGNSAGGSGNSYNYFESLKADFKIVTVSAEVKLKYITAEIITPLISANIETKISAEIEDNVLISNIIEGI